ncbi:MAG: ferredoxin [Myxococcota bacterium]
MSLANIRSNIERAFFGDTLDDVMDRLRLVSRSVDEVSARMDRHLATLRKELRSMENAASDARDGLFIIEDDCISCQVCVDLAPTTFRMRDDGIAEVYNPYGSPIPKVQEAIESCGGSCIKLA